MGYEQQINLYFDRFNRRFDSIVPNVIAETATEFFKEKFTTQEWDGVPWPALSPAYAAKKTAGRGRVLTRTGLLANSIRPVIVTANRIVIGAGNSKVGYAKVHNEGMRITGVRKVRSYTNNNFMGKGKRVQIRAHTRTVNYAMPKRQFMGNSIYLNQRVKTRLVGALNSLS